MKQKIVFIASLSHSGSTLLNLLLGAHPRLIGLGELDSVLAIPHDRLDSEKGMRCSCGQRVADCLFWAPAFASLQQHPQGKLKEKYEIVFQVFRKIFGDEFQIVDSSKYLRQLNNVRTSPNVDLKSFIWLKTCGLLLSRSAILSKPILNIGACPSCFPHPH